MIWTTHYQKNKEKLLKWTKDYYQNNEKRLWEQTKSKYWELSYEEKNEKREYGRNRYQSMFEEN